MALLRFEQGKLAYRADMLLYGIAPVALAAVLLIAGPRSQRLIFIALAFTGFVGWTLAEYVIHRFVFHGLQPFSKLHAEHHRRPTALICTPTILSASIFALLVFAPALLLLDLWRALALTQGVLTGYFAYTLLHHAAHHWRIDNAWFKRLKLWHALHHRRTDQASHYGVTCEFWDHMFGSDRA